ncbi:MAG: hypothetical protein AVDCRST_MAG49-2760 [uncultured Thermomicrobiales bacterium]|uniref:Uncharacterized protein n=1 Tax=uncultured Thermomicrobiales bacterium TaxID=1645740 RepID=A0A6J4UYD4_9BACT|nr:MAG: hypothetical protein AVDCRST_MAG49-2760 [uncultured Thermomicrobiales bacterium]
MRGSRPPSRGWGHRRPRGETPHGGVGSAVGARNAGQYRERTPLAAGFPAPSDARVSPASERGPTRGAGAGHPARSPPDGCRPCQGPRTPGEHALGGAAPIGAGGAAGKARHPLSPPPTEPAASGARRRAGRRDRAAWPLGWAPGASGTAPGGGSPSPSPRRRAGRRPAFGSAGVRRGRWSPPRRWRRRWRSAARHRPRRPRSRPIPGPAGRRLPAATPPVPPRRRPSSRDPCSAGAVLARVPSPPRATRSRQATPGSRPGARVGPRPPARRAGTARGVVWRSAVGPGSCRSGHP